MLGVSGVSTAFLQALCLSSQQRVALKVYRLTNLNELERLHLFREVTIHARLHHPQVVEFYAAFKVRPNGIGVCCSEVGCCPGDVGAEV